jgi:hypothetical protein
MRVACENESVRGRVDRHPPPWRCLLLLAPALLLASGTVGCAIFRTPVDPRPTPADEEHAPAGDVHAADEGPGFPHLVLRLGERRLYMVLDDSETPPESFPVAIGRPPWETPTGRFRVREMVENPDWVQFDWNNPSRTIRRVPPGPKNPLGLRWIGFATAHGWEIGFHGTPRPELLGQAVSHGCVRMRNSDVVKVFERITIGTTVIVEP